jgi:thermopsin
MGVSHPGISVAPATAASSSATSAVTSSAPSLASRAAYEQEILQTAQGDHIPLAAVSLPNLLGQAQVTDGIVGPSYPVAPAPMGIGTWGVTNTTGTPEAYTLQTTSWEGSITLGSYNSFWLDNDGAVSTTGTDNAFGVQLNAVTSNSTVGDASNDSFWTQNVLYFNLYPGEITFLDNVWNFSSPAVSLTSGTIYSGNGTPVYPEFYYDFGPSFPVTLPVTVHLYLNSSTTDDLSNGYGYTTVRFGYDVVNTNSGRTEESGVYDTVEFNSTTPYSQVPVSPFLVDGSQVSPTGYLPYDAEIMIGGPGGGTTTSFYEISGSESLQYWDSARDQYVNTPSAWDVAADTGETSEGIAESYTTPGTVSLGTGPSIVEPFWNATPGGTVGQATFSASISPTNAFVFFTPGTSFNTEFSSWAPTQTASHVSYVLPPGTYTVDALLSDHTPIQTTVTARAGQTVSLHFALSSNSAEGVYTPLVAWDNAQLAAISSSGSGTARSPYVLDNNAPRGGLNAAFGEVNDYLYPVFPGVLLAGTTDHVDISDPSSFGLTYNSVYDAAITSLDLPLTNNLQFELFDTSNVALWGAHEITGWFFFEDYGPSGLLPLANVVVWGGSNDLVGDNSFVSQGSSLLLASLSGVGDTVVWGNTFVNSSQLSPTMYPADGVTNGPPVAIFAFESGDLIYNNAVLTSITAYAPDVNFFNGEPELNLESWNLSMVEPSSYAVSVDGYTLSGAIVGHWEGGNYWADYVPAYGLPYDEYGYIASGGDYFPLPITAYSVTFSASDLAHGVSWSVTLNGVTQTTTSTSLVFYETPGSYGYTDSSSRGSLSPSSGTVNVVNRNVGVGLTFHSGGEPFR